MEKKEMKRISLSIAPEVYGEMGAIAARRGQTITGLIRDALANEVWVQKERDAGGRFLLDRDGEVRALVLR